MALFYPQRKLAAMKNMIEGAAILKLNQLIITITVIFTVYSIILILITYLLGGINLIYSSSLVFAAITGGGFVPLSTYVVVDNVTQLIPLVVGMIISALPFAFHYGVFSKQVKARKVGSGNICLCNDNGCFYSHFCDSRISSWATKLVCPSIPCGKCINYYWISIFEPV